ncbi:homocysteine S-methyltransferase family protein [Psychrobacter sp. NPDC078631]|uniref:homocysteine S-methyltransferase family protein n=1 Tax=Psychrobacter sp. NPDC078631 TaxID=3390666 RepID=UPI003CFD7BA2
MRINANVCARLLSRSQKEFVINTDYRRCLELVCYSQGASLIGGCCGIGPEHIQELSQHLTCHKYAYCILNSLPISPANLKPVYPFVLVGHHLKSVPTL